jgi:acyl-CoA dehydrogenase
MSWDFSTDPEYQEKLDWADAFVREEVEPLDLIWPDRVFTPPDKAVRKVIDPLKQAVRDQGLWATHLEPALGGQGHGAVRLCLLNEILGRSSWAPVIFGCQAPDTGNAEIIAKYGTPAQKERYLRPLLGGEVFSSFSMTEPEGGADPTQFKARAVRDGDEWVINGYKFFSSNARSAAFIIVMVVTDPDAPRGKNMSMFLVPADTPGIHIERDIGLGSEPPGEGAHALIRYDNVRVPADAILGGEGNAFAVAQTRLGGGRIHHAMRTIAQCQKALDMLCERALSRYTAGGPLSEKQFVQGYIADSYAQLTQFRLFVLYTAWEIDSSNDYRKVRKNIAAVKATMPAVYHDIAARALQVHGALGASNEMPFVRMVHGSFVMGLADGPTEVHKVTVAKQVLRSYEPVDDLWPSEHLPKKLAAARAKYAAALEDEAGDSAAGES